MYIVYVLTNLASTHYVGHTNNLARRLRQHNGLERYTGYTTNKGPRALVYQERFASRSQAMKRERFLKSGQARVFLQQKLLACPLGKKCRHPRPSDFCYDGDMVANLVLIFLNLLSLSVALLVGEYEVAKLQSPAASWLSTPVVFDFVSISIISILSLVNLAVLLLVVLRGLDQHRRWLWWTSSIAVLGIVIMAIALDSRLAIMVFPNI